MKQYLDMQRNLTSAYGDGVGPSAAKRSIIKALSGDFPTGKLKVIDLMWGLKEGMPPLGQAGTSPVVFRQDLPDNLHGINHEARSLLCDRVPLALKGLDSEQPVRLAGKVSFEADCEKFGLPLVDRATYDLYRHREAAEFGFSAPAFFDGRHYMLANAILWLHKFPNATVVGGVRCGDVFELLERYSSLQIRKSRMLSNAG